MSSFSHRASKRRRRRQPATSSSFTSAEERTLHQETSKNRARLEVPWAPVFYPTVEEMEGNPLHYVEKIRPIAEKYGICKVVPPKGWKPNAPFCKSRYCCYAKVS